MRNKKLFKSAVIITAVMLSVSGCAGGCSKQAEPVIAESTEETPEPEESIPEESEESLEPTPSPTVEPTEEPVEESSESEEEISSEEVEPEESEPDLGYEIIPIDEVTMYATTNCNLRSGPGTQYDKVGSLSYAQEITVDGKVEKDGKQWFVLQSDTEEKQMVSGTLVVYQKPQPQQTTGGNGGGSSTGNGNTENNGNGNTGNGGGGGSTTQAPADEGGAQAGDPTYNGGTWQDAGGMDWGIGNGNQWH